MTSFFDFAFYLWDCLTYGVNPKDLEPPVKSILDITKEKLLEHRAYMQALENNPELYEAYIAYHPEETRILQAELIPNKELDALDSLKKLKKIENGVPHCETSDDNGVYILITFVVAALAMYYFFN
jgi:hypothetical protein